MTTVEEVKAAAKLFHDNDLGTPQERRDTPFTPADRVKALELESQAVEATQTSSSSKDKASSVTLAAANQEEAAMWASGDYAAR